MDSKLKLIADSFGEDKVKLNEPLSEHTALNIGGPAKLFFVAVHKREIVRMLEICEELDIPVLVFGSGSKMMISDGGFLGVAIKNRTSNIAVVGMKGAVNKGGIGVSEALIEAESGVVITKLVEFLDAQGLESSQIKVLTGTVGGNLFLRKELAELAQKIKVIEDSEIIEIEEKDLRLNKHIVLSVVFKFKMKGLN